MHQGLSLVWGAHFREAGQPRRVLAHRFLLCGAKSATGRAGCAHMLSCVRVDTPSRLPPFPEPMDTLQNSSIVSCVFPLLASMRVVVRMMWRCRFDVYDDLSTSLCSTTHRILFFCDVHATPGTATTRVFPASSVGSCWRISRRRGTTCRSRRRTMRGGGTCRARSAARGSNSRPEPFKR